MNSSGAIWKKANYQKLRCRSPLLQLILLAVQPSRHLLSALKEKKKLYSVRLNFKKWLRISTSCDPRSSIVYSMDSIKRLKLGLYVKSLCKAPASLSRTSSSCRKRKRTRKKVRMRKQKTQLLQPNSSQSLPTHLVPWAGKLSQSSKTSAESLS